MEQPDSETPAQIPAEAPVAAAPPAEQPIPETPRQENPFNGGDPGDTEELIGFENELKNWLDSPPEEQPAAPQAPTATATVPETPPENPEPAVQEAEPSEDPAAKNWRVQAKNPRDVAVLAVMKAQGLSIEEAYQQLFGQPPGAAVPATQTSQAPAGEPEPELETVEQLNAEAQRLRAERKAARRDFDWEKLEQIEDQLEDLEPRRTEALNRQAQAAIAADQADTQAWRDEEIKATALYPDAADDKSPLSIMIGEIAATMKAHNDPLLDRPEAVLRITQMAAAKLGVAPVLPGNSAPAATTPTPAPARTQTPAHSPPVRITPAGGNGSGAPPAPAMAAAAVDGMTFEDFEDVLRRDYKAP